MEFDWPKRGSFSTIMFKQAYGEERMAVGRREAITYLCYNNNNNKLYLYTLSREETLFKGVYNWYINYTH